jgi:TonB family protein
MLKRLFVELGQALREFRDGPRAFIASAIKSDNRGGAHRTQLLRLGLTIALLLYALAFAATLLLWSLNHQKTGRATPQRSLFILTPLPGLTAVKMPEGEDESGGGGGGGRNTIDPPSNGDFPTFALTNLVVAPRPEVPLSPPALPFPETVKVDPRIQVERDNLVPTGLPDGANILPSAGPGSGGGIGTGYRGGIGPDDGLGVGPGRDYGIGGGWPSGVGRRKPGTQQEAVDARPVLLNNPQPLFTEAARKNKIQGVVRVRILVDSNGSVREVVLIRGLPDGLNEQAIRAAYQMRFRPATKNGQPVAYWMNNVEVEFNLR